MADLDALYQVLQARKLASADSSYVASLYHKGLNKILHAAKDAEKDGDNQALIYEMADLWFHTLVLLAQRDITPQAVLDELSRRSGLSGLAEKAARGQKP